MISISDYDYTYTTVWKMSFISIKYLLLVACFSLLTPFYTTKAQSSIIEQTLDYRELKGLLLKHKRTAESMLGIKQFRMVSDKERPGSTIYAFRKESDSIQILIRVRKSDGLVSEIAWDEGLSTIGNLTHDAIYDGFTPVAGNSRYYNRLQKMALLVNYKLAYDGGTLPCILRVVEL